MEVIRAKSILIFITCLYLWSSCKKGEEDPSLSFRSRMNRISEEWILESGHDSLKESGFAYKRQYNMGTAITIIAGFPPALYEQFDISYRLNKDGRYQIRYIFTRSDSIGSKVVVIESSGSWSFVGKSSDYSNKEQILMIPTKDKTIVSGNINQADSILVNNIGTKWELIGLWHNKLHMKTTYLSHSNGYFTEKDYYFIPKK